MAWYSVGVRGEGLWVREGRWRWLAALRRSIERRFGFQATRVVQATSVDEAVARAEQLVLREARALSVNRGDEPFRVYVERVVPLESVAAEHLRGGFTFYSEGHNRVPA